MLLVMVLVQCLPVSLTSDGQHMYCLHVDMYCYICTAIYVGTRLADAHSSCNAFLDRQGNIYS